MQPISSLRKSWQFQLYGNSPHLVLKACRWGTGFIIVSDGIRLIHYIHTMMSSHNGLLAWENVHFTSNSIVRKQKYLFEGRTLNFAAKQQLAMLYCKLRLWKGLPSCLLPITFLKTIVDFTQHLSSRQPTCLVAMTTGFAHPGSLNQGQCCQIYTLPRKILRLLCLTLALWSESLVCSYLLRMKLLVDLWDP